MNESKLHHQHHNHPMLIFPHEFYLSNRQINEPSRKDISQKGTQSFSQKRRLNAINKKVDIISSCRNKKWKTNKSSTTNSQNGEISNDNDNAIGPFIEEHDDNGINEVTQLNHLVYEIKCILCHNTNEIKQMEEKVISNSTAASDQYYNDHHQSVRLSSTLEKYEKLKQYRLNHLLGRCFRGWRNGTISFMRNDIVERVEQIDIKYFLSKKKNLFQALSAITLGASSTKKLIEKRGDGFDKTRLSLTMKLANCQMEGQLSNDMVRLELQNIVNLHLLEWNRKRYLSRCFMCWRQFASNTAIQNVKAQGHDLCRIIFQSWKRQLEEIKSSHDTKYCFKVASEEVCRKHPILAISFKNWRRKARIFRHAKQLYHSAASRLATNCLRDWSRIAKKSKQTNEFILPQVIAYKHHLSVCASFRSWRKYTNDIKKLRNYRDKFTFSYMRMKRRRYQSKVFRVWRQQARYGRVSCMYSRKDLIEQLALQSRKIEWLESKK